MSFPADFIDLLKSRVPLAPWIEKKLKLTRKGKLLLGNCPFHHEKTSSFTVYEAQDTFHCFGCGAHGDLIKFVMLSEHLTFPESVQRIADTAGIRVPEETPHAQAFRGQQALMFEALEKATAFYQKQLVSNQGRVARAYLEMRHVRESDWHRFRLGYAPSGNALKRYLLKEGFKEDLLIKAGLISLNAHKTHEDSFDYFRDRLLFPILNKQGKPIAFGGRLLKEGHPKYLNSPETALFMKGHTLYGLSEALKDYKSGRPLFVVEGYLDVIRLFERGYSAVAPLGTAMTVEQMQLLWKVCPEPYVLFDGDTAGREATYKLAHRILPHIKPGYSFFALSLPQGEDPDSFLNTQDQKLLDSLLDNATPLSTYLWQAHIQRHALQTPEQQAAADAYFKDLVTTIKDVHVQRYYDAFFKEKLFHARKNVSPDLRNAQRSHTRGPVTQKGASEVLPVVNLKAHIQDTLRQRILLATVLNHPDLLHEVDQIFADLQFKDKNHNALREAIFFAMNETSDLDTQALHAHLNSSGFAEIVQKILSKDIYIHASFAHPKEKKETALAGWLEIWRHMVEEKMVSADITQLKSQLGEELTEEAWLKLRLLKEQKIKNTPS